MTRGCGRYASEEVIQITWDREMSARIREAAQLIGVTPIGLICYAVNEILETTTFTRAITRAPNIDDAKASYNGGR